jgi:hypothetical protein
LEENYSKISFSNNLENMNMNKMQVNEEAAKRPSEAHQPQKSSNEADAGYFSSEYLTPTNSSGSIPDFFSRAGISSSPDLIYNPYDQSYFSVNQNQTENILLQPNTEGLSSSLMLASSSGFSSPDFFSSNCLQNQSQEIEVYQMNPTFQTSGFYEQYDQTKTEDQILANMWRDREANIEDSNQILAYCLTGKQTGSNTEDFSSSMQSGFWVDNTYYQRWSTNSGTI